MSYDDDNIFAKILRGEAPAHVVDEDDVSLTFMDLMPQSEGHTLIIPKESAEDILHVSTEALGHVIRQTQRVAKAVDQAFHPDGVMIAQLNRAPAGQTVFSSALPRDSALVRGGDALHGTRNGRPQKP